MINLNAHKCKNCKRGYGINNSFLSGGVCLRCIRKALATRAKHGGSSSSVKTKGSQVHQNFAKTKGSQVDVKNKNQNRKINNLSMEELIEQIKHNTMYN